MKQPITVALGDDVRAGLDQVAAQQARSRSWVADHAIRQWLAAQGESPDVNDSRLSASRDVREPV